MGVTVELQNLRDPQLCKDITVQIEHAFSDRPGDWQVSIAGSRAAENWELRVVGPNGFERSVSSRLLRENTSPRRSGRLC